MHRSAIQQSMLLITYNNTNHIEWLNNNTVLTYGQLCQLLQTLCYDFLHESKETKKIFALAAWVINGEERRGRDWEGEGKSGEKERQRGTETETETDTDWMRQRQTAQWAWCHSGSGSEGLAIFVEKPINNVSNTPYFAARLGAKRVGSLLASGGYGEVSTLDIWTAVVE